jgi:hypothetical protein
MPFFAAGDKLLLGLKTGAEAIAPKRLFLSCA